MRHIIKIIILVFLLSVPASCFSSEDTSKYFDIYGGFWNIKNGEASFQTSWPANALDTGYSRLEWENLHGDAYMIGVKVKPYFYFLTVDVQYIAGDISGENTDTDWVGGYPNICISKADTDGDVEYWSIDLDILLYPFRGKPTSWGGAEKITYKKKKIEAILGYFHYEYNLHDTNLVQIVDTIWGTPTGPYFGLDSTYDFEWKGYKTGLSFRHDFVKRPSDGLHAFGVKLEYSYLWRVDFNGEGYWNLRDLHFTQEADDGTGYDFILALFYEPLKNLQFQLGHRRLKVSAEDGYDYRNGKINAYLDEVESSSKVWFLTLGYSF